MTKRREDEEKIFNAMCCVAWNKASCRKEEVQTGERRKEEEEEEDEMRVTPVGSGQRSLEEAWQQQAAGRLSTGTARNLREHSDTCYFVHRKSSCYGYTENVFLEIRFNSTFGFLVIVKR